MNKYECLAVRCGSVHGITDLHNGQDISKGLPASSRGRHANVVWRIIWAIQCP